MANFGTNFVTIGQFWTVFKATMVTKRLCLQFEDLTDTYELFAIDGPIAYLSTIYKGVVPYGVVPVYSQAQNDADKSDFETNYEAYGNLPVVPGDFLDPRLGLRFGNLTATSTSEVLISARAYNEQASQAQRSVKSSSTQDASAGSGAKAVRLTYLDSNYVLKTEDIVMDGTTAVATVATDIRFVERFEVIQGAGAAGAIELWTANNGTGTAICGIAAATDNTFLCHHYVPAGQTCILTEWGTTSSDEVNVKLKGQALFGANRVEQTLDLDNLTGIEAGGRISFSRELRGLVVGEKNRIWITGVPGQATSTVIRSYLNFWQGKA
jgi:hypothetical protein